MRPKKKQKVSKAASASNVASSKPASSSRSRRNHTRSASIASSIPNSNKSKKTRLVRAEPEEDSELLAQKDGKRLSPVWDGDEQPRVECWVELPAAPTSVEDRLMFFRPRNKLELLAKRKRKEHADSSVWHVDHEPADCDPFHFSEQDLEDLLSSELVALRPQASKKATKSKSRSTSVQLSNSEKGKERDKSVALPSEPEPAQGSRDQSKSRSASAQLSQSNKDKGAEADLSVPTATVDASSNKVQRAVDLLQDTSRQPERDGLEDMFLLDGNEASSSNQVDQEDGAPLFFDNPSDDEDKMRNGTPAGTQPSQRPRVKSSPSYGDRVAHGASSTSSKSSIPRPAKPASSSSKGPAPKEEAKISKKEKLKRRRAKKERKKKKMRDKRRRKALREAEEKKRAAEVINSDDEPKGKRVNDDVKNLRSDLNEDAFARSTGARHKEEYRNKLAAFSQARKKARQERGESIESNSSSDEDEDARGKTKRVDDGKRATAVSSDSESSDSEDDSTDDSDGDSDDSKDFIVGDDEVEYDEGFQPENGSSSKQKSQPPPSSQGANLTDHRNFDRDSDGRIRLVPISQTPRAPAPTSVLAAYGLGGGGARKGIDEQCLDWLEWAVARVLVTWTALSLADRERLERNRAALKSRMRSIEESVGSVTMRRQFKWYLTRYPKIRIEPVFSDEVDRFGSLAKQGCGICHRKSQKAQFKVTFSGLRYNQDTIAPLKKRRTSESDSDSDSGSDSDSSDESDSASDRSSDDETWREEGEDIRSRPTYTFFAGNHCAQRAVVMHKLHHWEWTTMQTLAKHESIQYIRRLLWSKGRDGRGKDGKLGAGAYEVGFCVGEMISPTGRCTWKGKEGKDGVRELDRLRKRLKSLNDQAIEVNRAR